jgi:hypothetical protein
MVQALSNQQCSSRQENAQLPRAAQGCARSDDADNQFWGKCMTEAVFQFKAIARKLNRQEQKAEFEEKNPPALIGADGCGSAQAGRLTGGSCESVTLTTAQLPPYTLQHGESLTDQKWSEATAAALRSYVRMLIKI